MLFTNGICQVILVAMRGTVCSDLKLTYQRVDCVISMAVRAFLSASAKGNTIADHPSGCLIGCCAPAAAETDPNIRQRLEHLLAATQNRLIERFTSETELPAHLSHRDRATMMLDFMNGQAIRARSFAIMEVYKMRLFS